MMPKKPETNSLLEEALVEKIGPEQVLAKSRPFGDPEYINECTWARYSSRLSMLEERLPIAKTLNRALKQAGQESKYRIIGDPTVRSAINATLAHFRLGGHAPSLDDVAGILDTARQQLENNSTLPPLQMGSRLSLKLGSSPDHGWLWTGDREEDVQTRYFRALVEANLGPAGVRLKAVTPEAAATLVDGAQLLARLLPQLSSSALNQVQLVAILAHEKPFLSVTNPNIPGAIFLSESVLTSPWKAAEYLLHESLHVKFLDIEHTHSLLGPGYQPTDCSVRPPWRRPHSADPYLWPMNRILTVTHVYAALALFFQVVRENSSALASEYGPVHENNLELCRRQSLDRAEYLVQQIHANQQHLGRAGVEFGRWLSCLLNLLDTTPRTEGAYMHLLADLYEREANVLGKLIAGASSAQMHSKLNGNIRWFNDTTVAQVLDEMLEQELKATEEIAIQSGEQLHWLRAFQNGDAPSEHSPHELAQRLWGVRALVCHTLNKVPACPYTINQNPALLDDMLLSSSRHVETILKCLKTAAA